MPIAIMVMRAIELVAEMLPVRLMAHPEINDRRTQYHPRGNHDWRSHVNLRRRCVHLWSGRIDLRRGLDVCRSWRGVFRRRYHYSRRCRQGNSNAEVETNAGLRGGGRTQQYGG